MNNFEVCTSIVIFTSGFFCLFVFFNFFFNFLLYIFKDHLATRHEIMVVNLFKVNSLEPDMDSPRIAGDDLMPFYTYQVST